MKTKTNINTVRKVTVKRLDIYTPMFLNNDVEMTRTYNDDFKIDNYMHYPIIIDKDNTQWEYANRYILSRVEDKWDIDYKTLSSISDSLINFKIFCNEHNIDYLKKPRRVQIPIWQYRKYLVDEGANAITTMKKKLGIIVGFYIWLQEDEKINFGLKLWSENIITVKQGDIFKKVIQRDITTIENSVIPDSENSVIPDSENSVIPDSEKGDGIMDGGKLHPINVQDQKIIFKALREINNIEMTLGFLISIATGARMQTVFTLRRGDFKQIPTAKQEEKQKEIRVRVGNQTLVDTKNSKANTLYFPIWLYDKIKIYIDSPRAIKRKDKAKHIFNSHDEQYIFLTNRGTPYYTSQTDPYKIDSYSPATGDTVRTFLSGTLKKTLIKNNTNVSFTFHDLRASFSINYINTRLPLVEKGLKSLTQVTSGLSTRLGHVSLETTQGYLDYTASDTEMEEAHSERDKFLRGLIDG